MAEVPPATDKHLERFLTCPLCHRYFNSPKMLPCLHTFCKGCLQTIVDQECTSGTLSCPECRNTVPLRSECIDGLQNNDFIDNLIDSTIRSVSAKTCQICAIDGESLEAVYKCIDCSDYLCENCRSSHAKTRQTREHKVVTLDDPQLVRQSQANTTLPCSQHPKEILRYFCVTCEQLICLTCLVELHKHHNSKSLEQATESCKMFLFNQLNSLTERKQTLDLQSARLKKEINDSEQMQATLKENIELKSKGICLAVQHVTENAIAKMESTSGRIIEGNKLGREVMESLSNQMEHCKMSLDLTLSNASDLQLLDTYSISIQRSRALIKMATEKSSQDFEVLNATSFEDETLETFLKECSKQILPLLEDKDVPENAVLLRKLNTPYSKHVTSLAADEKQTIFACVEGKVYVCKNFGSWTSMKLDHEEPENQRRISKLVFDKNVLICTEGGELPMVTHLCHYNETRSSSEVFDLDTEVYNSSLTIGPDDTLLLTDERSGSVYQMSKDGHILKKFGRGVLHRPCSAAQNSYQQVIVLDAETNDVSMFNKNGKLMLSLKDRMVQKSLMSSPIAIALDKQNYIYVLCRDNKQVLLFSRHGQFLCCLVRFGDTVNRLGHMTISNSDKLFIATDGGVSVYKLNRR